MSDGIDWNPQAQQMADESMVRNLAAQASCIWPQEEALFQRYGLAEDIRILDAGCGTGEITGRLAQLYSGATVLGVDILDDHLERARARLASLASRVHFENRSIYRLGLPDRSFDLVVCRHVLQSIPQPESVIAELARVTRAGGRVHVIAEDYGMMHFPKRTLEPDEFWHLGPKRFGASTGTDLLIGRHAFRHFRAAGLTEIRVDYVVVDTLRAPRESFAAVWEAWRDGYAEAVAEHTSFTAAEFRAHFDDMIATLRDPNGYAVWHVPVVSGRVE